MKRLLCLLLVASGGAAAAPADPLNAVAEGAVYAQTRCYRLIHHDTFDYEDCLQALLRDARRPTPRRLGMEYFGWVGAQNSARLGMRGAEQTAYEFLGRFRATQKRLRIGDEALCASVAGDCTVRIARMKQMDAAPRPRPAPGEGDDDERPHH